MELTDFLLARIDDDHDAACSGWSRLGEKRWERDNYGRNVLLPNAVLAECTAKWAIIETVRSWVHAYCDDDPWYSCGLAIEPTPAYEGDNDRGPGSGCADGEIRGECQCGVESRQRTVLGSLASVYAGHPDYRAEWAV